MARFQRGPEIREVVRTGEDLDARQRYCDEQRALLHAGWHRVRDPAREIEYPDDPRDLALESAIRADPEDEHAWLVLADFLQQHGHPRGPIVAIDAAPAKTIVERAAREAEASRLRDAAADQLALARRGLSTTWKRGFIHEAMLHASFGLGDAEDLLFDVLRHPSARFLRELVIGCTHHDVLDHRLLFALLLHAAPPPPLRRLQVRHLGRYVGRAPLGDLGTLGTAFPLLEDVDLEADATTRFTGLALPRAKRFALHVDDLPPTIVAQLARAPWPALEVLELWFGGASTCTVDDVQALLRAMPNVRTLRLRSMRFASAFVPAFVASPIAPRVRVLDLTWTTIDDAAIATLLAARDALAPDLRCDFSGISDDARRALEDANLLDERR